MSDASDEFDKEAEREKLREKYGDDAEKREHTQRMSELLLKGATMTNKHCDRCGDPIFRHDGQEFCPTCNAPAEGDEAGAAEGDAGTAPGAGDAGSEAGEPTETTEPATRPGTDATRTPEGRTPSERTPDERPATGGPRPDRTPAERESVERASTERPPRGRPTGTAASGDRAANPPGGDDRAPATDVDEARASLARTLTRFARAAEETDDPRRAREHLRAAREAAETLSALE